MYTGFNHTSYLSFLLHRQDFLILIFYTKKLQKKHPKTTANSPKKCKIHSFSHLIWKVLHRTEFVYTGTACGACDKYEVWLQPGLPVHAKTKTETKCLKNPICAISFEKQGFKDTQSGQFKTTP